VARQSASSRLVIAGWVGVTMCPMRRSAPRSVVGTARNSGSTLEGIFSRAYAVALARESGNNLLFLILASLLTLLLMSGILVPYALRNQLAPLLPGLFFGEHIIRGQPLRAMVEIETKS